MLAWVERLRQEWHTIKSVPFSFFIACVVIVAACFAFFNYSFTEKLTNAHELIEHWKSDADYWKDTASRTSSVGAVVIAPKQQQDEPPNAKHPEKLKPSNEIPHPEARDNNSPPSVNASGGSIAIGGNNSGTNSITNIGSIPRSLSSSASSILKTSLGNPAPNFNGFTCLLGDQEGCTFGEQIRKAFETAGWPNSKEMTQSVFPPPGIPAGLFVAISYDDSTAPPQEALRIFEVFRSAGLDVHSIRVHGMERGSFSVYIGNNLS